MKIYIYQIWFPTSQKGYIGQTKDIKSRMSQHLRSGSLVCKALWKYDDWQVTILHITSKELANQLEIEDIRNHNSVAPNGYNLTAGGEGGDTITNSPNKEKRREEMSRSRKGVRKPGQSVALKGNQNAKGKNLGNQFAKEANIGNQHAKGNKHTAAWKRDKSINNPMKNPKVKLKRKITCLKKSIQRLEGKR